MKKIKKTVRFALLSLVAAACSNSEEGIISTDITNITSKSLPGSIELNWEYPEGDKTIRYIEVSYYDHFRKKEVIHTASAAGNGVLIENTRQKYGEYKFKLQPHSTTFTPGKIHEIVGKSDRAPIINRYTSTEFTLTVDDIYIDGIRDSKPESLLDGDLKTYINTDYGKPAGTVFYIDFTYPKVQNTLKFSYINRNDAAASFPAEIECYVKANEKDEWQLIKTLTLAVDGLPTVKAEQFVSKEYDSPIIFKYFRFRVPKTHTGKVNFSLAEFRIFDVDHFYYDPEAPEANDK